MGVGQPESPHGAPDGDLDTEHRILRAARSEFVQRGLAGARMQAIADRAGVNKALLHYYYRSKTNLYDHVLKDIVGGIWGRVRTEFDSIPDPADLRQYIRALVSTFTGVMGANPDFPTLFFREIIDGGGNISRLFPDLFPLIGDVPQRLVKAMVTGMQAGTVRPAHPAHLMINILGMTASSFLFRELVPVISKAAGVPIVFDDAFMQQRIDAITHMACDGIFIEKD